MLTALFTTKTEKQPIQKEKLGGEGPARRLSVQTPATRLMISVLGPTGWKEKTDAHTVL